jgi:glycosyltransferase involved in cell wall biosynthesis
MVSIVIPSRNEYFLNKTIDDLLSKARGEIEIIVVLDGMWQEVREDPRVKVIHHGGVHDNFGLRDSVNRGMDMAQGEYVMKADGHTMWDEGFDLKLIEDCEDNWVVIPRRYRLEPESWTLVEDGRPPIDYMFIAYPYERPFDATCGLHGDIWKAAYNERRDLLIDDLMTMQGSAYFMKKTHWEWLGGLDDTFYGPFTHEAQEISNKTWLGGGRVIVNKKTWYAHLHKGKKYGTGYGFSTAQWANWKRLHEQGRVWCIDHWVNNKWEDRMHDWEWLINKFWNFTSEGRIPTWPDDWKTKIIEDEKTDWKYSGENTWQG